MGPQLAIVSSLDVVKHYCYYRNTYCVVAAADNKVVLCAGHVIPRLEGEKLQLMRAFLQGRQQELEDGKSKL